jgi:transcriptional regulator with XRE-family HTH domain
MAEKSFINNRLTEIREEYGYNMKQVAEGIDMKPDSYRNYETGRLQPSVDTILKLAEFYGVTTDYLLGRTPKEDHIQAIADENGLCEMEEAYFRRYMELKPEVRKVFVEFLRGTAEDAKRMKEAEKVMDEKGSDCTYRQNQ